MPCKCSFTTKYIYYLLCPWLLQALSHNLFFCDSCLSLWNIFANVCYSLFFHIFHIFHSCDRILQVIVERNEETLVLKKIRIRGGCFCTHLFHVISCTERYNRAKYRLHLFCFNSHTIENTSDESEDELARIHARARFPDTTRLEVSLAMDPVTSSLRGYVRKYYSGALSLSLSYSYLSFTLIQNKRVCTRAFQNAQLSRMCGSTRAFGMKWIGSDRNMSKTPWSCIHLLLFPFSLHFKFFHLDTVHKNMMFFRKTT